MLAGVAGHDLADRAVAIDSQGLSEGCFNYKISRAGTNCSPRSTASSMNPR